MPVIVGAVRYVLLIFCFVESKELYFAVCKCPLIIIFLIQLEWVGLVVKL